MIMLILLSSLFNELKKLNFFDGLHELEKLWVLLCRKGFQNVSICLNYGRFCKKTMIKQHRYKIETLELDQ